MKSFLDMSKIMIMYCCEIPLISSWDLAEALDYNHNYLIYAIRRYVVPVSSDDVSISMICGVPSAYLTPAAINTLADNHIIPRIHADHILYIMATTKD